MAVEEDISLDPRVGAVEIQDIVVRADEDILEELDNRSRSIAPGKINRVIVARWLAEEVAQEQAASAGFDAARAMHQFKRSRGGRENAVLHDERRTVQ